MENRKTRGPLRRPAEQRRLARQRRLVPRRRLAHVQPRAALATMLIFVVATGWWLMAQSASKGSKAGGKHHPFRLSDLPGLMEDYGQRRAAAAASGEALPAQKAALTESSSAPAVRASIGTRNFPLTERDLTAGSPADEREPAFGPGGDFIAFVSNGADTKDATGKAGKDGRIDALNADGPSGRAAYHVWVMNRDGSQQRQLTGLTTLDKVRDQRHPAWSPEGTQIVYIDGPIPTGVEAASTQLFVIKPFVDGDGNAANGIQPSIEQRTFSPGEKRTPVWSPTGLSIVFSSNYNPKRNTATSQYVKLQGFDIFTISPSGNESSVLQLTGFVNAGDPTDLNNDPGGVDADDLNPAFSFVNQGVIYFSSNRRNSSGNTHRRIWLMDANGRSKRQITDPTQRSGGTATDDDDYPAPSQAAEFFGGFFLTPLPSATPSSNYLERVAFHSNSLIDASDGTRDLNVWSLQIDTTQFVPLPTPPPPAPPAMMAGSFIGEQIIQYDPQTGARIGVFVDTFIDPLANPPVSLSNPEGITFGPDGNLYVCNRNNGRGSVDRFDGITGAPLPASGFTGATFATGNGLTNPAGITFGPDGNIYVSSGNDDVVLGRDTNGNIIVIGGQFSSNRVHRFNGRSGQPMPAPNQFGSTFTNGESFSNNGFIDDGIEGITFGPDMTNDGTQELYVTALSDNKINVYNGRTGAFVKVIVQPGIGGLSFPTDVKFGPDLDGDTVPDMYVSSSGTDAVLAYSGDVASPTGGTFIRAFVDDNDGAQTGLDAPERMEFGPDANNDGVPELYVTSFDEDQLGNHVCRYDGATGAPFPSVNSPNQSQAVFATGLVGAAGLAFNASALAGATVSPSPSPTGTVGPIENAVVGGNAAVVTAQLESNLTSSPDGFGASGLSGGQGVDKASEDKSGDREPSFARSKATPLLVAQLVFASQRRYAAAPGPNTDPIVVNPSGGAQNLASGAPDNVPTHDIWATGTQDFTPPILVPQGAGNVQFPVLAPGPQAPFAAPRTFEEGLAAGGPVIFGFVLKEQESGLQSVTLAYKDADSPRFDHFEPEVNEQILIDVAEELEPRTIATNLPATFWDDGPLSTGGHERQAGAIRGDGIFYCQATFNTSLNAGDYYADISVVDKAGNSFVYDNIWGFATRQFQKATPQSDLFISDYTVGQEFPYVLSTIASGDSGFGDVRFNGLIPSESYWLTNPGGDKINHSFTPPFISQSSRKTTFDNVDVWRVLCRGPVPTEVLDAYTPRQTLQIDPNETQENGDPGPFKELKRSVAVSQNCVIWAAPYTGDVFAGPGTVDDADSQRRLTQFTNAGGRLFISGKEIVYSLSNAGTVSNTFLNNELQATFVRELFTHNVSAATGAFRYWGGDFDNPQFPINPDGHNTYADACFNQDIGNGIDVIGPGAGAGNPAITVIPAYTVGTDVVGQRIEQVRSNGIQSRVVFFSFGFEGVNKRYTNADGFPLMLNVRPHMADEIRNYFKTGGVSGAVINDATNLPVPGFLLEITGTGGPYYVRTDQNGNYELTGLPSGSSYIVRPAVVVRNGRVFPQNPGFFNTQTGIIFDVFGGSITGSINFRVIPSPAGSVSGKAVSSAGTPGDVSDDTVLPNLTVLIRSVDQSSIFPGGGHFARLATTDAGGRFSIDNVPSNAAMELVFNPEVEDIPEDTGVRRTYEGPNIDLGRRVIPDADRPDTIFVPVGDNFAVNDGTGDDATDSNVPIVVPLGHSVSGRVFINNTSNPAGGATVTLTGTGVNRTTTTTASGADIGKYSFNDIKAGTYTVTASADSGTNTKTASVKVTVTSRANTVAPDLILTRQAIIGFVHLNDRAAANISVDLFKAGALQTPIGSPAITAADGSYKFDGIDVGNYVLRATKTTAPAITAQVNATVVAGKDTVAPIIDLFSRRITGTIKLDGKVVGGAVVQLLSGANEIARTSSAATGVYNFFDVVPGNYTVRATKSGDTGTRSITVTKSSDVTGVDISLFLAGVTGRVLAGGSPTGGATVQLLQNSQVLKSMVSANTSGAYSFTGVGPGSYQIRATKTGATAQITVTLVRGQTITAPDIALPLQTISGRVVLKLSPAQPGTPYEGATVQLLSNNRVVRQTSSNKSGDYSFLEVPVGSYTLVASNSVDRTPPAAVTVRSGFNVTASELQLVLQNVTGRVLFNGQVASGVEVKLLRGGALVTGVKPSNPATTGGDGTYFFSQVPAGTYLVSASLKLASGQTATDQRTITVVRTQNLTVPDLNLRSQTIAGRVTLNGAPLANARVTLLQGGTTLKTATSAADGTYRFDSILAGNYSLKAEAREDSIQINVIVQAGQNLQAPDLRLLLETVSGTVKQGQNFVQNALVQLLKGGVRKGNAVRTDANGSYTITDIPAGAYTVFAQFGTDQGTRDITVTRGVNQVVPAIVLGSSPNPTPTATQPPDFAQDTTYLVSIPYADSSTVDAVTTVAKAFTSPARNTDGTDNFLISRYDPVSRVYVALGNGDTIRRGEGYFIKPMIDTLAIKRRDNADNSNVLYNQTAHTDITSFDITLRNDPSRSSNDSTNGFNLIGVPFNPVRFSQAEWFNSRVDAGSRGKFASVRDAAAAGIMSAQLFEFDPETRQYKAVNTMTKFKGYYVRTFVNGVKVTITALP